MTDFTTAEMAKWDKLVKIARAINLRTQAAAVGARNISAAVDIGRQHGITLPGSAEQLADVADLQERDDKLQHIIGAVEMEELGLRFTRGDIDIMALPGATDEELAQYRGFGLVGIIIGIVIVAGAIALGVHFFMESTKIAKRNKILERRNDELLSGQALTDWQQYRQSVAYTDNQSFYEDLMETADEAGKIIRTSSQWGIALAIPLGLWMIFKD
jgi:hypothetical protein